MPTTISSTDVHPRAGEDVAHQWVAPPATQILAAVGACTLVDDGMIILHTP